MSFNLRFLRTSILPSISLTLLTGLISACSPPSVLIIPISSSVTIVKTVARTNSINGENAELISITQGIYRSERFNFQFSYSPVEVVIEDWTTQNNDGVIDTVAIWTHDHDKKIRSGVYGGGTEYPANVNVTVHRNSKKFPLTQWVNSNQWFVAPREVKPMTVAQQSAISFESTGLYEHRNVAIQSPDNTYIIVISWSYTGYSDEETIYKNAFEEIITSFTFSSSKKNV